MKKIKQLLIKEISKDKPDRHHVSILVDAIFNKGMDLKEFIGSGRIMTKQTYLEDHDGSLLHPETLDLVMYLGGYVIQIKKPSIFFIKGYESKSLDDVEAYLWEKKLKKHFGKINDDFKK